MIQMKICNKCNIEQELSNFYFRHNQQKYYLYCKKCAQHQQKLCRDKNKDKKAVYDKVYNKEHKEYKSEYNKAYRRLNIDIISQQQKEYCLRNKLHRREIHKAWRDKNLDKVRKSAIKYRKENPEKYKAIMKAVKNKRRCACAGNSFTKDDILKLFKLQSNKCVYCKSDLCKSGTNKYHVDHVIPLSKGGNNESKNIQLLCKTCNLKKGAKMPEDFAPQFGMLL